MESFFFKEILRLLANILCATTKSNGISRKKNNQKTVDWLKKALSVI